MSKRTGIQLAYPFEERRLARWKPPYIIQPKFNGERCRAVYAQDGYILLSSEANLISSVPHIVEALNKTGLRVELDGELYRHGMVFEDIHSRVSRTANLHPDHRAIQFHIFDCVIPDTQMERTLQLIKVSNSLNSEYLHVAEFYMANSFEDVMTIYDEILLRNYEGIIVRHLEAPYIRRRSTYMMKFKPKKTDTYRIVGYQEEHSVDGVPKDSLGALVCEKDGQTFNVGSGFLRDQRKIFWEERESLPGKYVRIEYQNLSQKRGVPVFQVVKEILDEYVEDIE